MKITIVSVSSTPWTYEGRSGVSWRADAIVEIGGKARVCRVKLPSSMNLQPGTYELDVRAYVDPKGFLAFSLGDIRPIAKAEK